MAAYLFTSVSLQLPRLDRPYVSLGERGRLNACHRNLWSNASITVEFAACIIIFFFIICANVVSVGVDRDDIGAVYFLEQSKQGLRDKPSMFLCLKPSRWVMSMRKDR